VNNIEAIHRTSRFPLLGAHKTALCIDCHKSENYARYDVNGVLCIDCHRDDYNSTTNPNHIQAGFSEDCSQCHPLDAFQWQGSGFNHSFFPLEQAHAGLKCSDCHKSGNYTDAKPVCYSCHQTDYNNTVNPNHKTSGFPVSCEQCHTAAPGWKPASYTQHDVQFFPIYSGSHKGKWTVCTECHPNTANYQIFDCKRCHSDVHKGKNYTNEQCYACHPRGRGD
jgi:nitrate/TMAO reductase-like tetraheme cytochrome c subunit